MDYPITVMNLSDHTSQAVFDQIAQHLLEQGVASRQDILEADNQNHAPCMYWNRQRGLKCAAGCLIPEDFYSPGMEYHCWVNLVGDYDLQQAHMVLISDLQMIHDNTDPDQWHERLVALAVYRHLDTRKLEAWS